MKKVLIALAAVTAAGLPLAASAQLTANVSLTSNYKFRGQDQDASRTRAVKPALQGGFDYTFGDTGFYVGNWNSSVDWLPGNSLESDFYGGYKMTAGDFALDFGALAYIYSGYQPAKTIELYASAGWGPLVAKYSHTVSDGYFAFSDASGNRLDGTNTGYFNVAYAQEIFPSVTLKAALGYTRLSSDIRHDGTTPWKNYTDYSVGAAYDFGGGVSLSGSVVGATKKETYNPVNRTRLVVALTKTM
ncbi:TorF family putative porin [Xylophilus sp. GOD-11R]|uniref:TorF family putative porin n=1 Tax=Xylophilus sp. GOD-11R TaxID=3089814 RepID=UPI00298CD8A4|nr:TorF family putative porin [Xylophilus sp. GOD-11R]WPB56843.1 TorF family putative porin [Xylophilus sp. GOD-11R]